MTARSRERSGLTAGVTVFSGAWARDSGPGQQHGAISRDRPERPAPLPRSTAGADGPHRACVGTRRAHAPRAPTLGHRPAPWATPTARWAGPRRPAAGSPESGAQSEAPARVNMAAMFRRSCRVRGLPGRSGAGARMCGGGGEGGGAAGARRACRPRAPRPHRPSRGAGPPPSFVSDPEPSGALPDSPTRLARSAPGSKSEETPAAPHAAPAASGRRLHARVLAHGKVGLGCPGSGTAKESAS